MLSLDPSIVNPTLTGHPFFNPNRNKTFMTIYYLYAFFCILFSGLGIVFLNAESILALCFFLFLAILLQNSDSLTQGLENTRQTIQSELQKDMLIGQRHGFLIQQYQLFKKRQLLTSMEHRN
jgi:hypothetical protein